MRGTISLANSFGIPERLTSETDVDYRQVPRIGFSVPTLKGRLFSSRGSAMRQNESALDVRIYCQIIAEESQITFIWSDGACSFDPYELAGEPLLSFKGHALSARQSLHDFVEARLNGQDTTGHLISLARAGYGLYSGIFRAARSKEIQQWLLELQRHNVIPNLEIVLAKGRASIPWNVVYNSQPSEEPLSWQPGPSSSLNHFWGLSYNLAISLRVDPWRRIPWLENPRTLFVIDPPTFQQLAQPSQDQLRAAIADRNSIQVSSRQELLIEIQNRRPDLIYWFSHATPEHLYLGNDKLTAHDLFDLLDNPNETRKIGIAFLNACRTAEAASGGGTYLRALSEAGLSGIVGTEEETIDYFANEFGMRFLTGFLGGQGSKGIARIMREMREGEPLGLLYSTYCPPHIHVLWNKPADASTHNELTGRGRIESEASSSVPAADVAELRGRLLGLNATNFSTKPLPDFPYLGLAPYEHKHRSLFVGREFDGERFAAIVDSTETRIVVLQGSSGVGKSSFLLAEVIPFLEEENIGYGFLRAQTDKTNEDNSVLFVRTGKDLIGGLAQAIWNYVQQPIVINKPNGKSSELDLLAILREKVCEINDADVLSLALRTNPILLHHILFTLSNALPFALVAIIDQAEELFTQAQDQAGVMALQQVGKTTAGDYKLIISVRTEYYGRLVDALRQDNRKLEAVREYLLTDFGEAELIAAIEQPTVDSQIRCSSEIPFRRYGFRYELGLAEKIARDLLVFTATSQDSVLPLLQIICAQLFARVQPGHRLITKSDLAAIGGVMGGMVNHVDGLVAQRFPNLIDRRAFKKLLSILYLSRRDGGLTTALVPEDILAKSWRGRCAFNVMVERASERGYRLLRRETLRVGTQRGAYISLGHDALARVAFYWANRAIARRRIVINSIGTITALVIIAAVTTLWWVARASNIAAAAKDMFFDRPDLSIILAAQANRMVDNLETRSALLNVLEEEPTLLSLLHDHRSGVCATAFSQDSSRLATVDCEGTLRIWEMATYRPVFQTALLANPSGGAHSFYQKLLGMSFLDRGTKLVVVMRNGKVEIYELDSNRPVKTWSLATHLASRDWRPERRVVDEVSFTQDGRLMAWTDQSVVRFFDSTTGNLQNYNSKSFTSGSVYPIALNHDGTLLAFGGTLVPVVGFDRKLNQSSSSRLEVEKECSQPPGEKCLGDDKIGTEAFSPGDSMLALASGTTGCLKIIHLKSKEEEDHTFRKPPITALSFSARGQVVAVGSGQDRYLHLWDRSICAWREEVGVAHVHEVNSLNASPDGRILASASADEFVALWNIGHRCRLCEDLSDSAFITAAAFSPQGDSIAVCRRIGNGKAKISIWNGSSFKDIVSNVPELQDLIFLDLGKKLLGVESNGTLVSLRRPSEGSTVELVNAATSYTGKFAISTDGKLFARTVGPDIELWDLGTRSLLGKLPSHFESVTGLQFSTDNRRLMILESRQPATANKGRVSYWDGYELKPTATALGLSEIANAGAFSKDGEFLAEGEGHTVGVWNLASRTSEGIFIGINSAIQAMAFSRDNKLVATVGHDGNIQLRVVATQQRFGRELRTFIATAPGPDRTTYRLEFDPGADRLLSLSSNGQLTLWTFDQISLLHEAELLANRNMSPAEWRVYNPFWMPYRRTFFDLE
jgi:WD40 repeat protein